MEVKGGKLLTNATLGVRFSQNGGEAEVANLDLALVSIDENVVTLEISVDHWRAKAVEIEKASQNLPTPMLHCPYVDPLVF